MNEIARGTNLVGAFYALTAFGIYSTHDVVVKTLGETYSPFQLVFFSTLFGFPIVTVMLMSDSEQGTLRPRHPWWTLLRTVAAVITTSSAFYAFSVLPMAQTYAIIFAAPLLITVLAIPILGERVGWRRSLAVTVGLIGVLVVLQPGATVFSPGHVAALTAAVSSAVAAVIMRKIGRDERSAVMILYPMMANFLLMACAMPFVYKPMSPEHLGGFALIALLGFGGALCHIAAYRAATAVIVAPMQYSQILWAVVYGYVFFAETPDWNTAVGATVIIASGVFVVFREERPDVSNTRPVLRTQSRYVSGTYPRISTLLRVFRKRD